MDGNGRWAKKRGLPRKLGHREGGKVFRKIVEACIDLDLQYVTFYALSTENTSRPKEEVEALVKLFDEYLDDIREMSDKNTRLRFIGGLEFFPKTTCKKMQDAETATASNTGMTCCLALNYGGRSEIIRAVSQIISEHATGISPTWELSEENFANYLYTRGMPNVDLVIRTGGERRISNFLLWQAAYAEYYFTDVLWPDFGKENLATALGDYAERNRRFGGL